MLVLILINVLLAIKQYHLSVFYCSLGIGVVERMANDWPLPQAMNMDLFYIADEKGYTDYPIYEGAKKSIISL